jgi:fimbrial chaperone protein
MDHYIKKHFIIWIVLSIIIYISCLQPASAAYGFDKVRIELSLDHPVDTLKLNNSGKDTVVNLQITTQLWEQVKGEDVFHSNKELIVAPPIMKIQPGNTQIVRIGWRHPIPLKQEIAYRIQIQDLTPITNRKFLIQFKVEASIPIFIQPTSPIFKPQWQVKKAGNQLQVLLTNNGNIHIQVKKITLTNSNNEIIAEFIGSYYALPLQSVTIPLSIKKPLGSHLTLTAETDNGKVITDVGIS